MFKNIFCAGVFSLALFTFFAQAQDCQPPAIVANAKSSNIFTPEQETALGNLIVESMSGDVRLVRDEELLAYVNTIGNRLIKHLPPIGLKYKFHIMDISEANAFNIPGGHVFLSRKLIAFAANEDELAGVMAHELGHATVRHGAVDMSEMFRKVLNVSELGDSRDVAEKYNLLIENARTKRVSRRSGHENEQQLEADRIGLFAMTAAGYDPTAFTSFFDRLTESEGRTGNWFSDVFGKTRPEQKRLREMTKLSEQLPASCRENRAAKTNDTFLKWQADVVLFRERDRREFLPGLMWKKELAPKLRSDITRLSFSPDGKYLLAQDDFSVTVIQREPLQVLFQIPAESPVEANFSPDGSQVVFTTENLRFERWDVGQQKPLEVRELVLRSDCWESRLSPDGNYLACVDFELSVDIIETKTGKKVFEKKKFYPLSIFEFIVWSDKSKRDDPNKTNFFRIEFSPDSRYVVVSRSDRFRFSFKIDLMEVDGSENTALGIDLTTFKAVDVGGDLKKLAARPFAFVSSNTIIGLAGRNVEDGGLFSFPNGKRLQKFPFSAQLIKRMENSDYIAIKPIANAMMGIYDVKKGTIAAGFNKADAALWTDIMATESAAGKILLQRVKYNEAEKKFNGTEVGTIEIPVGSIGNLRAAGVSDDFKWMAMSSKSRGGTWNLESGERKMFVRGFKSAIVGADGGAVAEFPRYAETPHSLVLLNSNNNSIVPIREMSAGSSSQQFGRFVLFRRPLKEKSEKKDDKKSDFSWSPDEEDKVKFNMREEVKFELLDIIQNKIIWSRDFPKDAPPFSFDEYSGRLILYWELGSQTGKAKLKEAPELQAKADALGNKNDDYLVEVIDAYAARTIGWLLVETGKGSFDVGSGLSEGDWLMFYDSEGRVLIYSLKTGELRHRFFGTDAALNPKGNLVAVENFPGEVTLYRLDTGERAASFVIKGDAAFVRFNLQGSKLFILSDTQSAYAFDLTKVAAAKK